MRVLLNDAAMTNGQRIVTATVDGQRHEIPERWMMGYCAANQGAGVDDAIRHWHQQARLEAQSYGVRCNECGEYETACRC